MFWILGIGLMFVGSEASLKHSRTAVIGGFFGLLSGMIALGMAETPRGNYKTLHEAAKDLSDHLDFCQECNEPFVFCPKGLQLKNAVVELLKK